MSKSKFAKIANALPVSVDGSPIAANAKNFSTGSVGWNANGKVNVKLSDGSIVKCQLSLNLTVVGSKEWPAEDAA